MAVLTFEGNGNGAGGCEGKQNEMRGSLPGLMMVTCYEERRMPPSPGGRGRQGRATGWGVVLCAAFEHWKGGRIEGEEAKALG